ncbi:hypothetical protein [Desulfosediminicola sp.]|uniref:hypothetical protein n=1 Tax=Desulfosediminicola sp. TaxID=2886825 RepID=UPI003AF1EA11
MSTENKPIELKSFRDQLHRDFLELVKERGKATELAKVVGKTSSFVTNVRQGKPVNAYHLKAVGELLGNEAVLKLLDLPIEGNRAESTQRKETAYRYRVAALDTLLLELEKKHPRVFERVEAYIHGAIEAAEIKEKVK